MKSSEQLREALSAIHRKSYPAYKSLKGSYDFRKYQLHIDHVQGDPFASPSHVSISIPFPQTKLPEEYIRELAAKTALEDVLLRRFAARLDKISFAAKGSGKSGLVSTSRPGQTVLSRTALCIRDGKLTARFLVGFPANGRTIDARGLEKIFFNLLPDAVEQSFYYRFWEPEELRNVYELAIDQQTVRKELKIRNLVAFVANGSILPRQSGVSDRPLKGANPFRSPESMEITMELPYHGEISGLGIPAGITLIIGGGYHGKSTLLHALEQGVFSHIKGDGREFVITEDSAMKLRAEDGRSIRNLDISPFIHDLPNGTDTTCFSTENASGSTSQAAAVIEGIEAGAHTFLIDEDTSATNFMVRDAFMQDVVHGDKEPITPFIERIREIFEKYGISTVLVAGSSGDFFHIADHVLQMDAYRPVDVKEKITALLAKYPRSVNDAPAFCLSEEPRPFWKKSAPDTRGRGHRDRIKTKVQGTDGFSIDRQNIDLRYVEQLSDPEQMAALSAMLKYAIQHDRVNQSVSGLAKHLYEKMEKEGLESFLDGNPFCGYTKPRLQEIFAMLNRVR